MMQLYYPSISWAPTVLLVVPHVSGLGNIVRPGEGPGRLETGMEPVESLAQVKPNRFGPI